MTFRPGNANARRLGAGLAVPLANPSNGAQEAHLRKMQKSVERLFFRFQGALAKVQVQEREQLKINSMLRGRGSKRTRFPSAGSAGVGVGGGSAFTKPTLSSQVKKVPAKEEREARDKLLGRPAVRPPRQQEPRSGSTNSLQLRRAEFKAQKQRRGQPGGGGGSDRLQRGDGANAPRYLQGTYCSGLKSRSSSNSRHSSKRGTSSNPASKQSVTDLNPYLGSNDTPGGVCSRPGGWSQNAFATTPRASDDGRG